MDRNIILMTATGAENLGDELITFCELIQLREKNPETTITLFSHDPSRTWRFLRSQNIEEENLKILPYFPTHIRENIWKNIIYFTKTLQSFFTADHIYIGGGGLLYGVKEEWHSPILLWWLRAKMAKFLKKPVTYLSLWISAKNEELKKYAHGLFHNTTIHVRDKESQKKVTEMWYTASIIYDPVFSYVPAYVRKKKDQWKAIWLALRKGFLSDEIVTKIIRGLIKEQYTVYLLPHSLHPDDMNAHDGYYLQNFLLPGVKITQTIEQTLSTYWLCDVIIGMRLHSIILATVLKIPLIAISYSTKTDSILKQIHADFMDAKDVSADKIIVKIQNLLQPI